MKRTEPKERLTQKEAGSKSLNKDHKVLQGTTKGSQKGDSEEKRVLKTKKMGATR